MNYDEPCYEIRVQRLSETPGTMKLDQPQAVQDYWREKIMPSPWFDAEREICVSIVLNTRLYAMCHSLVSIGTLNESIVHCREVFRAACVYSAYGVLTVHNHPSGDPQPSSADEKITRRLADAGRILQIHLFDHVIIGGMGEKAYFSFREAGMID